jgi:alkyldihydroxyacetonephosphate synthase
MTAISRDEITDGLREILGSDKVITDTSVLREYSMDRFRKLENIFGIFPCPLPAAVAQPTDVEQVAKTLKYLNKMQINCVPRTGGSATEGGLETVVANTVVVDGSKMNRIVAIDEINMLATAQCGVNLEILENRLRERGLTTGHSPQSKPLAQMGGLVATRSIGQLSTLYGGIEDMVVGVEAVFPNGEITRIKSVPRRASGPDLRHVIIGNEGAVCYVTEVTVKLFKYQPQNNRYYGFSVETMKTGFEILREVMVHGLRPSVARLYDFEDGSQHGFDKIAGSRCLLMFVTEGCHAISKATGEMIEQICSTSGKCQAVDSNAIEKWFADLNWGPEKIAAEREFVRDHMRIGFTTEVSGNWSCINAIYDNALKRLRDEFPHAKDLTLLGCHSSHSYVNGTNLYFVYEYNVVDCAPSEEINKYHIPINTIIVEEALKAGGSMCHHHGVGKYRTPWIKEEHGSAYYILKKLKEAFDPQGIMNAGTIFPIE